MKKNFIKEKIPIEVSARHIHISQNDLEKLFGKGYKLKKFKQLSQASDFAAKEKLDIQNGKIKFSGIRIVGPPREKTQVELSITDAIKLGIKPILRESGDVKGTPGIILINKKKKIKIREGVIIPLRHIHCSPKEAKRLGLKNGEMVSIKIEGKRGITFHNVKVRVKENYRLCMHIDTDEGNAAGINKKAKGFLIGI